MTVLLTGATGFLGRAVRHDLAVRGHNVVGASRTAVDGIRGNLGDIDFVLSVLKDLKPSAVVNCAATIDFKSDILPNLYQVNALLPAVLASWCRAHDAHLVQASTIAVHGLKEVEFGPTTTVAPDTDYGRSKWLAEVNIQQSGCAATILRFGGLFGLHGPDHLGLNRALRSAQSGVPPTVVAEGRARRNYVFVCDAAATIRHCIEQRMHGVFW